MKLKQVLFSLLIAILIFGCNDTQQPQTSKIKSKTVEKNSRDNRSTNTNATETQETNETKEIVDYTPQLPYEIKEDGLYIYNDGPALKEKINSYSYKYVRKNYSYIRVKSSKDKIISVEVPKIYRNCGAVVTSKTDLGKPTLFELGYERHKEREIKPEDNRFGVDKKVEKPIRICEKRLWKEISYDYIPSKNFTQMTTSEFLNNGIVIIGKHISRVVIKSIEHLPKYGDKILVKYEKKIYKCNGEIAADYILKPEVIADFKRINFKENIFEFIRNKPLPGNSDYLSDVEFTRLCENIHQLIPRKIDRTIHKKYNFRPGYYLIEYYNGEVLYDYHCIKLGIKGSIPKLWDALSFGEPTGNQQEFADNKYVLVVAECNSESEAVHLIKQKDSYPLVILPYKKYDGKILVGRLFYDKNSAEIELQRLINMGFKKESMKIISLK